MARIVMKFGGTSMAGIERIRHVASRVRRESEAGNEVLVDGSRWAVVRPRIDVDQLMAAGGMPDWLSGCAGPSSS